MTARWVHKAALEATTPEFAAYAQRIVDDSKKLGEELAARGFRLVTGGTDNHMLVVDVTPRGVTGKQVSKALDRAGIVCNFNSIPFDPRPPMNPSGIRIGTAGLASRGATPAGGRTRTSLTTPSPSGDTACAATRSGTSPTRTTSPGRGAT